ncbi:hypothetical protein ACE6ED_11350 [Paenibacillus sp. CN-4]|uniref:hypothetical protein n=1 Tax=Paenibacillus nanchangensis TaxID=3348343 RepID=UPI00397C6850
MRNGTWRQLRPLCCAGWITAVLLALPSSSVDASSSTTSPGTGAVLERNAAVINGTVLAAEDAGAKAAIRSSARPERINIKVREHWKRAEAEQAEGNIAAASAEPESGGRAAEPEAGSRAAGRACGMSAAESGDRKDKSPDSPANANGSGDSKGSRLVAAAAVSGVSTAAVIFGALLYRTARKGLRK